uniref:Uncharacterized protein n=1 Tax=Anguilla anguilla TaxID=7936 RepID=A0A0E9W9B7_ANGAN
MQKQCTRLFNTLILMLMSIYNQD